MESVWSKAFNSFGFIALLICVAALLTTISFSNADASRDPPTDLSQLHAQGVVMADIRSSRPGIISHYLPRN